MSALPPPDECPALREPGEGVTTDPALLGAAEALCAIADLAHSTSLHGGRVHLFEWMRKVGVGDLVYVFNAFDRPIDRVGTLVGAWSYPARDPDYADEVWMIATLDGRAVKWSNCTPLRIPRTLGESREARWPT